MKFSRRIFESFCLTANALDLSGFENVDVSHGKVVNFRGTGGTTLCLRKGTIGKGEKEYRRKQKRADIIRKTNDGKSLIVAIAIEKCSR